MDSSEVLKTGVRRIKRGELTARGHGLNRGVKLMDEGKPPGNVTVNTARPGTSRLDYHKKSTLTVTVKIRVCNKRNLTSSGINQFSI